MYNISQLNDLLVPELQDIAIEQNISNAKKLDKQELISQILNKQNTMNNGTEGEKPKRKRIIKPLEQPKGEVTHAEDEKVKHEPKVKKAETVVSEKRKPFKKEKEEEEAKDDQPTGEQENDNSPMSIAPALVSLLNDDIPQSGENQNGGSPVQQRTFPQRREPAFNIEFDGIILGLSLIHI